MNKRIQIILLLMLLCLASCGSTTEDPTNTDTSTQDTTAVETDPLATVPVQDLGGYTCTLYSSDLFDNFSIGEENGDVLNDGIYRRDLAVAERLHLTFDYQTNSRDDLPKNVSNAVMAGDDVYDIVFGCFASNGVTLLQGGNLIDLNTVANFDFTKDHWSKLLTDELTYNDRLYFTSGDIVPTFFYTQNVVLYNNAILEELGMDSTPYDDVVENRWNYDAFLTYETAAAQDLNGDGKMDKTNDRYGFTYTAIASEGFYIAGGNYFFARGEDGSIQANYINDRSSACIEELRSIFGDKNIALYGQGDDFNNQPAQILFFQDERSLFIGCSIDSIMDHARSMESDFTIVPCPKYDMSQTDYVSSINPWVNCAVMLPKSVSDPDRSGLIAENLAALGKEYIRPAVYENVLHHKIARNDESVEMLEMIFSRSTVDLNTVYNFGNTPTVAKNYMMGNTTTYVSDLEKQLSAAETAIQDYVALFAE